MIAQPVDSAAIADQATETKVLIIGTGFSGLGLASQLLRHAHDDFIIVERSSEVGGVWRDNTYPGAAVDVESHLYSFSWRLNPKWSKQFAPQEEILQYLKTTADEEQIRPHIRFETEVLAAEWDESAQRWEVSTTRGFFRSQFLVAATGHLADPSLPDIRGLELFGGEIFHSARWNHQVGLSGAKVAVIGSGASAIQIVPEVQKVAKELVVFQRTAPYIIPRNNFSYSWSQKQTFEKLPHKMMELRDEIFWHREGLYPVLVGAKETNEEYAKIAVDHRNRQISDPDLKRKLTPDYAIGCKRILLSDDYYPALESENVILETTAIREVDRSGITTLDGSHYDVDIIVLATGFEATDLQISHRIFNQEKRSMAETWQDGVQTFASSSVKGFPNFFFINGPHTSMGHLSIVFVIEAQISYILGAIEFATEYGVEQMEVKQSAQEAYVDHLNGVADQSVWVQGGCKNWYTDKRSGKISAIWPDWAYTFRVVNGEFSPVPYRCVPMQSDVNSSKDHPFVAGR